MNYHYVRRIVKGEDRGVVDIPIKDLRETLKRNPEWVDLGEVAIEKPVEPVTVAILECPICGFIAKTEKGLQTHKKKHYV